MKLDQGPVKSVIGCPPRPRIGHTTSAYTKEQDDKVTVDFAVPKRACLKVHICPPTWSDGFCGGKGKRGAMVRKGEGP